MCMILKKMCMILSPNCCASTVTIFEYSSTDVTLLPSSCLSVLSEHVASQSKWQSGKVCGQRYSEVTCAFSLITFQTSVPF